MTKERMENDKGKGTKEIECQGHAGHCSAGSSSSPITPLFADGKPVTNCHNKDLLLFTNW